MRQIAKLVPALAASLLLAACGSSSNPGSASAPAPHTSVGSGAAVVKTAAVSSLGSTVLVDSQGLTLYHLSGEQNGKWICTSAACVKVWHPVVASSGSAPSGSVGSLATVKRPDGATQVTYRGLPLYTFVGDTKPGEAKGQGIKDVGVWTALTTKGATTSKPVTATTAPAPSSSSSSGYGY
jgi:predicted lipoprotein with Yx(FWY)xxD motif